MRESSVLLWLVDLLYLVSRIAKFVQSQFRVIGA